MSAKRLHPANRGSEAEMAISVKGRPGRTTARRPQAREQALGGKPWNSVRASKVARARKLIQKKDYPSPSVLRAIAELFSRQWKQVGKRP